MQALVLGGFAEDVEFHFVALGLAENEAVFFNAAINALAGAAIAVSKRSASVFMILAELGRQ